MNCVLELISINTDSNKFLEIVSEKSFYDNIQNSLILVSYLLYLFILFSLFDNYKKEFSQNKTPNELKSLFGFFISNIKYIEIEIDSKLADLTDNESK